MKTKYLFIVLLFISQALGVQAFGKSLYERIYLQTDKEVYLSGELMWFKLMTCDENGYPLVFSKVAYLELVDDEGTRAQLKVELEDGIGDGSLVLPTTLSTANYRLVAYTQYMRNESPMISAEKIIGIINPLEKESVNNLFTAKSLSNEKLSSFSTRNSVKIDNNSSYKTRTLVELSLGSLPKDIHSLSVSVVARDFISAFPHSNIEQWQQEIHKKRNNEVSDEYLAEYEGHIIRGELLNTSNTNASSNQTLAPFISFLGKDIRFFAGKIGKDNKVYFITKNIGGSNEAVTTISNDIDFADNYKIELESPFISNHGQKALPALVLEGDVETLNKRSMAMQVLYSYTSDSLNRFKSSANLFNYKPNYSYLLEEYRKFATMQEVVTEFVAFVSFKTLNKQRYISIDSDNTGYSHGKTLVLLDNIPLMNHEILFNYNPQNIKKIDVYMGRFVFGERWFEGILNFSTHNGDYPELKPDASTRFFNYEGTQLKRIFYSPEYTTSKESLSRLPDFRSTLYWNPDMKVECKDSILVPFYTSDYIGRYKVVVEGITKDGQPIYATSEFTVK